MKFISALLLTAILAFAAGLYLPWWTIGVTAFVVAVFLHQTAVCAFLSAFIGLFILWGGLAFYISTANDGLFAHKMSVLILKSDNNLLLYIATGLIGGLVGGFAAVAGSFCRKRANRTAEPAHPDAHIL